jgi:hypothetical protein
MHLLARAIGLRGGLCLVAGLAYGFAPYRAGHLAHLQVLSAFFVPLVFLAAHRFVAGGRRPWLVLLGAAWVLQGLTNGYYLVYVSVLLGLWVAWFGRSAAPRRVAELVLAWAAAVACLAPVLVQYARWHARYAFERTLGEIEALSADVLSLLVPAPGLAHWAGNRSLASEAYLFPGATLPLVLAVFLLGWLRRKEAGEGRATAVFVGVAAVAAVTAGVTALTGPWRLSFAGLSLSVKALAKPLAVAFYALVFAALSSRSVRGAWKRGSVPAFYVLGTAAMTVLAFGPGPRVGGLPVWDKAPYFYLLKLPGVLALRSPARAAMLAAFCLAVAGAIALGRLVERRGRGRLALTALAAAAVLWDGWLDRVPIREAPSRADLPDPVPRGAAVLELPMGVEEDTSAMYRGMAHGLPLVNGYSGHNPAHYHALERGLALLEPGVLGALRERGPILVLVDQATPRAEALRGFVRAEPDVRPLGERGGRDAFFLPGAPGTKEPALGTPIATTVLRGSPGRGVFELDPPGPIGAVLLRFGSGVSALPSRVTIEAGDAGSWKVAWYGQVTALALRAALRDPGRVPVLLETPGASGRLLRVRVAGSWTVEEVAAFRPAGR